MIYKLFFLLKKTGEAFIAILLVIISYLLFELKFLNDDEEIY